MSGPTRWTRWPHALLHRRLARLLGRVHQTACRRSTHCTRAVVCAHGRRIRRPASWRGLTTGHPVGSGSFDRSPDGAWRQSAYSPHRADTSRGRGDGSGPPRVSQARSGSRRMAANGRRRGRRRSSVGESGPGRRICEFGPRGLVAVARAPDRGMGSGGRGIHGPGSVLIRPLPALFLLTAGLFLSDTALSCRFRRLRLLARLPLHQGLLEALGEPVAGYLPIAPL